MHIRKTAAVVLAMIIALSFALPVFAATGYADDTSDSGTSYTPSTSSTPSTPAATVDNPAPVTAEQVSTKAAAAIEQAIQQAVATPGASTQATVRLENVSTVSSSAIQSVFAQATKAGVANAVVQLDAREGNKILSRVYVDAATAAKLSGTVDFSVSTTGAAVERTVSIFEKFFDNKTAAVSLGQKGAFGADIKMAAKVDLSGMNTKTLIFYVYNKATNQFATLKPAYTVDANGYLHFSTPVGGDIVITDKPLVRK